MELLVADERGEAERVHWLIRLRWVAIAGVASVVISTALLDLVRALLPLFALSLLFACWNLTLWWGERRGRLLQRASHQMGWDLLALGGLLAFSGGVGNPFSIFLVVQVILAAMLLPERAARRVGLAALAVIGALVIAGLQGWLPPAPAAVPGFETSPSLAQWGIVAALVVTTVVAQTFTLTLMRVLRRQAEETARYHLEAERERGKLREVLRSLGAGLVVLGPDLEVEWSNRAARSLLPDLKRGQRFSVDDEEWPPRGPIEAGQVAIREWRHVREGGPSRLYEVSATPVRHERELVQVVCVLRDISRQHATRQQLQQAEKLAALGRLSAGIAHEIATPLGSVDILANEIQAALDEGLDVHTHREIRSYARDIRREVDRIGRLVRELLDLGHPAHGEEEPVALAALLGEATQLISMRSRAARDRIRCECAPDIDPVELPKNRLLQVLINLLDNALDATEENRGLVIARAFGTSGAVSIEIEDQGVGIAEEDRRRVFDPFFTTKEVGEGTGLGLYVSYEIVRQLGGEISLESERGRGTTVRLKIPRREPYESLESQR